MSTNLSRRTILAGAAALPALAAPAAIAVTSPVEIDPIFAVIDEHRRAYSVFSQALDAKNRAEEKWLQDTGVLGAAVLPFKGASIEALEMIGPGMGSLIDLSIRSGEDCDKLAPPGGEFSECNRQLRARLAKRKREYRKTFGPLIANQDSAADAERDAAWQLRAWPPSSAAGVAAVLAYLRENYQRDGGPLFVDEEMRTFLACLEETMCELAGLPPPTIEADYCEIDIVAQRKAEVA